MRKNGIKSKSRSDIENLATVIAQELKTAEEKGQL